RPSSRHQEGSHDVTHRRAASRRRATVEATMTRSLCDRSFLVIGDSETARRACASLTEAGRRVCHLQAPSDDVLHEILERPVDGVAILLRDDIAALRYCLAVHH